ncbi:hypothetical protein EDB84DRAFT_513205 [Lactarius hengduanensis]|nr:hypothetical protein EDB84DRAFT_513205 [Lactarius hengduanensis]
MAQPQPVQVQPPPPQPNFPQIGNQFANIAEQIHLVPNPVMDNIIAHQQAQAAAQQQWQQQVTDRQDAMQVAINELTVAVNGLREEINGLRGDMNGLRAGIPMQLANTAASARAPIQYPPNTILTNHFPRTKDALSSLSAANCQFVAHSLGLPALQQPTVRQRRQQIKEFLGCAP